MEASNVTKVGRPVRPVKWYWKVDGRICGPSEPNWSSASAFKAYLRERLGKKRLRGIRVSRHRKDLVDLDEATSPNGGEATKIKPKRTRTRAVQDMPHLDVASATMLMAVSPPGHSALVGPVGPGASLSGRTALRAMKCRQQVMLLVDPATGQSAKYILLTRT